MGDQKANHGCKEKYIKDLKPDLALVARDSVTKVVYTKLFDWLVRNINKNLKRDSKNDQNLIGVLDIYGFEHFAVNSFEQFCINYANEKLQQEFNAHVFRLEQERYIKEAIRWEKIEFTDNQGCIELIEGRMRSMALLDEDSRLPGGTDATFIGKIVTTVLSDPSKFQFGKTKVFLKSGQIAFFENRRKDRINYLILLAQKNIKKFIQRNRYLRIKESAVVLQSAVRGHLAYKHYMEMRAQTAAVKLQTAIRGYLCRKRYHAQVRSRSAALTIQRCWRGYIARKTCAIARDRVVLIQSCVRKLLARKVFKMLKLQAKDLNKAKEKTFGLESKVLSLSKALQEKAFEAKQLNENAMLSNP
ncbi:Unconventional myosin-Va [Chytriomyces hyalinus]|nr:Unconventional myosin-Va [Chytriomyces hyalinus]